MKNVINSADAGTSLRMKNKIVFTLMLMMFAGCGNSNPVKPSESHDQYERLAREVFVETNKLRTDPDAYRKILEEITHRMSGNVYQPLDSKVGIETNEGASAVYEAADVVRKQKALRTLKWSAELAVLARAHVVDTGAKGLVSHESSTGSTFSERVESVIGRDKFSTVAENLSYGYSNGRDVVSQLFVDDGVPGRGHRDNLLKKELSHTGVACGYHSEYGHMCVAIYASR